MEHALWRYGHLLGAILLGGGLIGVWLSDLRSRQVRELVPFAEAVRSIALFYDGVVIPGAVLLLVSGAGLIAEYHGGWAFTRTPWLLGMVVLFVLEFVEGNTITRLYFLRLLRLSRAALAVGAFTPELLRERGKLTPTFTHFLDLPVVFVIVALGVLRPDDWSLFAVGVGLALTVAAGLTLLLPRLYPWHT